MTTTRKPKKQETDLTTDAIAKKLFPREVIEHLKKIANPPEKPKKKPS